MTRDEYGAELTAGREEIAATLGGVADGVLAGAVRLGDGPGAVTVAVPDELDCEVELGVEDGTTSLKLELEWPSPDDGTDAVPPVEGPAGDGESSGNGARSGTDGDSPADEDPPSADDGPPVPVGAAGALQSLARFEVYRDRAEEWRWRLRHRNGNIIATGGEGYTRKHNARKGLRSVVRNAPGAEVTEESPD